MGNWNRLGWLLWIFQSYFLLFSGFRFWIWFCANKWDYKVNIWELYDSVIRIFLHYLFFSRLKLYLNIHIYHCLVCFFCGPFLLQMFSIYDKLSLLLYCFIQQHFLLIKRRGCFLSVFISLLCFTQPRLYLSLPIFYSD